MKTYVTFSASQKTEPIEDLTIIKKLERIGFKNNGNDFIIKKNIQFILNDEAVLNFDDNSDFDSLIKEQLKWQDKRGLIELP